MTCGCEATISESDERASLWKYILGDSLSIPLKHPMGVRQEDFPSKLFLVGDASALAPEQKQRFLDTMARRFGLSLHEVTVMLNATNEIPILDEGVTLSICKLHTRMISIG